MELRRYEILVHGHLAADWSQWFGGLGVRREANGETILSGPLDQAALQGVLAKIRDLGLTLVEVRRRDQLEKNLHCEEGGPEIPDKQENPGISE